MQYPINCQNGGKMAKSIPFKTAEKRKNILFGAAHTYMAHIKEKPLPKGGGGGVGTFDILSRYKPVRRNQKLNLLFVLTTTITLTYLRSFT